MNRLRARASFANVVAVIALFVALGGTSLADPVAHTAASVASDVKKALKLGKSAQKRAKAADKRAKAATAKALAADAKAVAADAKGAGAQTTAGQALAAANAALPAGAKAADADKLDGKDSAAFLGATASAADALLLGGKPASAFLAADGKAANADKLDDLDSTAFLPVAGKAADANTLDTLDSGAFVQFGQAASNSDLLDGQDSTAYTRGNATLRSGFVRCTQACFAKILADAPGVGLVQVGCSNSTMSIGYNNASGIAGLLWADITGDTPKVDAIGSGVSNTSQTGAVFIHMQGAFSPALSLPGVSVKTADFEVWGSRSSANSCTFTGHLTGHPAVTAVVE
jgi:hypothetical protein